MWQTLECDRLNKISQFCVEVVLFHSINGCAERELLFGGVEVDFLRAKYGNVLSHLLVGLGGRAEQRGCYCYL